MKEPLCIHKKTFSSCQTHSSQSTATSRLMSWVGRPTAVRIRSIVTRPALGILAAPTLARVAVRLDKKHKQSSTQSHSSPHPPPTLHPATAPQTTIDVKTLQMKTFNLCGTSIKSSRWRAPGVGPPMQMNWCLNVRVGVFNLWVCGVLCHKNVRMKVVHPWLALLTEEHLGNIDTWFVFVFQNSVRRVVASCWWFISPTVHFFYRAAALSRRLFTVECLYTAAVLVLIYNELTVFAELHPHGSI